MQALYIAMILASFIIVGAFAPFAYSLGYIWADTFGPQNITSVLQDVPASLIMGILALLSYIAADRRHPPPLNLTMVLTLSLAIWVTLTTIWALVPVTAWMKWDWAFKTLVFSAFMPFVFRSRVQIEAAMLVYIFSLCAHIFPFGVKTIISGGGYGHSLGLTSGRSGLDESSTLATVAVMCVPLLLHFRSHSMILPPGRLRSLVCIVLVVTCVFCAVGTYARTGLIALGLLTIGLVLKAKRKILFGLLLAVAGIVGLNFAAETWIGRMSTITSYQSEDSALGRILVWKWTYGFALEHPFGGGFNAYRLSVIEMPSALDPNVPVIIKGKAFHNVYFEILGEHGWIGLGIFLALVINSVIGLLRTAARARKMEEMSWAHDLARCLLISLAVLLVSGFFIGIAFQPFIWYMFALEAALRVHVYRVAGGTVSVGVGARAFA